MMLRLAACCLLVTALAGCGVVSTAADVTATAVGTAVDVTATAVETTADVATSPFRSDDEDDDEE
jgi:uncharacterized protein YabE (DUF348 family)